MSGDHFTADLALARCQTVRHEQQAHQVIAACRLDGDRDLIVDPHRSAGWPRELPIGRARPESRAETARGRRASTAGHHLHHHHEAARRDLIEPVPPFPAAGVTARSSPRGTDHNDGRMATRHLAARLGAHRQPGRARDGRRDRGEEVGLAVGEVVTGPHHAGGAPARSVGQEQHANFLVDPQRPPDVVESGLRLRSRSGKSESLAIVSLRRARVANLCGSSAEYSASASRGSYSGGVRASPLVMVLITSVSGSIVDQQVRSVLTLASIRRIAAACRSLTPSPEAASAAMSPRAR